MLGYLLLLGLIALSSTGTADADSCGKVVCYHTNWSQYRPNSGKFFPENIDPSLCTHMVYAFAKLNGNHLQAFEWNDDSTDWSVGLYERFQTLKQQNPNVKTLLAVGGWNMGSADFTQIVQSPSNRQDFITHSIQFLRERGFDGLDLDWEYPANRGSPPEDREHFTELVRELRKEYEHEAITSGKPRLLLTAAVAAGKSTIDTAYDIPAISKELDFINLMSYDLHGAWETVTGHNSPLYARSDETGDDRDLNIDFAAKYWADKGTPKDKLIIGMALYGRSFTLASASNNGVGAQAPKGGTAGQYTRESGFLSYYEVCDMKKAGGQVRMIDDQRVPYITHGDQWIGFDSPESLREKVRYVKSNNFGGVMVWALPLDDFSGTHCGEGKFPLMNAIVDECQHNTGSLHTPAPPQTTLQPPSTEAPPTGQTPPPTTPKPPVHGDLLDCQQYPDGFYSSHRSCHEYFICSGGATYAVMCADGLVFNPNTKACDWPSNYECTIDSAYAQLTSRATAPRPATTKQADTQRPTTATQRPTTVSQRPATTTQRQTTTTQRPTTTTQRPTTTTQRPTTTTRRPTTQTPVPTTQRQTTQKPTTTTTRQPMTTAPVLDLVNFCKDKTDGVHADPTDCAHFVECSNGYTYRMSCAKGSVFNPDLLVCDNPFNVPSCLTHERTNTDAHRVDNQPATQDVTAFCRSQTDGIYSDPRDCTRYIQCGNRRTYVMSCPAGTAFNPTIGVCDRMERVPCDHRLIP